MGGWSLPHIASLAPDRTVTLVRGNREREPTEFVRSTLGAYLEFLAESDETDRPRLYLKEFDLLKAFPQLRADLRHDLLFPPGAIRSCSAWIGPAGARTGLHYDLLDNLAVQILGRKRFYLAPPGTGECGAMSGKYDRWARLSTVTAEELARARGAADAPFVVELFPGDVLFVPAQWWHEVVNIDASLLLSGFFGPKAAVVARWAGEGIRHGMHRLGLLGRNGCTCHAAR